MKNLLVVFLFSLGFQFSSFGQTNDALTEFIEKASEKKLLAKNSEMLLRGNYRASVRVADKLLTIKPESANYHYRKGYALVQGKVNLESGLIHLQRAEKNITKKYNAGSVKETDAPYDVYYHLGHCYHQLGNIDEAEAHYKKYIELSKKHTSLVGYAQLGLKQCEIARRELKQQKSTEITNLGGEVNTEFPDYSSVITFDGSALYFTSRRLWDNKENQEIIDPSTDLYLEDIYVSYRDFDGAWVPSVRMENSESNRNEATVSVNMDESRIYLYSDKTGYGDIFYSDFEAGRFDVLQSIEVEGINTDSWEPHLAVTPDGNTLFFVSERKNGLGGRDIYRITKLPDGTWSQPCNLGPKINTPYDEDAPFIGVDGKTLYFSSNGEHSMGGFDIFVSVLDPESNQWSHPVHLGAPLNSTGDDLYFSTTSDGKFAYFSSMRNGGFGEKDIYELKDDFYGRNNITVLKGLITVVGGEKLPDDVRLTVTCLNCAETNNRSMYPRGEENMFMSHLDKCREYALLFAYDHGKTVFYTDTIAANCLDEYEEINKSVLLRLEDWKVIPDFDYIIAGIVRDKESGLPVTGAKVELIDQVTGKVLDTVLSDASGAYSSKALLDLQYDETAKVILRTSYEGYLTSEKVELVQAKDSETIVKDITIEKLDLGKDLGRMLAINTIYFDFDKSNIRESETEKLDKIVKVLNENPTLKIELGSHTDCRGTKGYNQALSQRRAQSTSNYIRKRITNPSRIVSKGYGESQLTNNCPCEGSVASDCNEEQHQLNRRTEFKIIGL
jgi:outer membrane protein OmpA-like peptidoglycan-associated protein/tetratricopeptide (TPR) repeat protein